VLRTASSQRVCSTGGFSCLQNHELFGLDFSYKAAGACGEPLKPIPYKALDLNLLWQSFDLSHELTTKGIQKFVADYRSTLKRSA